MPRYKELAETFGEQGLDRDATGNVVGYRFPKPKDEAARLRQNYTYLEMSQQARRIEIEDGAIRNAAIPSVALKDWAGHRQVVPERHAERVAKRKGLRPVIFWGRRRRITGEDYDPHRPLRTWAEIRGW